MVFRFLSLKHGIQFHYYYFFLAFWTGCVFGPEAWKRVWRLPLSSLLKWCHNVFFKKVSFKKYCVRNKVNQGHEHRTLVLDRVWKPWQQTFTQTSLSVLLGEQTLKFKVSINHPVICWFRVLKNFWLVSSKGTVFHNFHSLFSSLSLYFFVEDLVYWC